MVCPPQGGRWRLPAEDVLAATGCRAGKRVEGNAVGPADDLHDPLSLPGDETSTMRCRINLHDALSVRNYAALKRVTEFIYAAAAPVDPQALHRPGVDGNPPVASVQDLDRLTNERKWGPVRFFHTDFDYVNGCAYFDYQRQRVFVRTSKTLKKNRKRRDHRNRKLRASRWVQITSSKCPSCGGTEVMQCEKGRLATTRAPRIKRAFDLVFTRGGVKRRVVQCRAPVHRCLTGKELFVPNRYQRLAKHGHGLMSWAMYEHIAHRTSCWSDATSSGKGRSGLVSRASTLKCGTRARLRSSRRRPLVALVAPPQAA